MTLEEFLKFEKDRTAKFEKFWKEEHTKDPEGFPDEMNLGEWDEQLMIFDEE